METPRDVQRDKGLEWIFNDWRKKAGRIVEDPFMSPHQPSTPDYAVEARIKVIGDNGTSSFYILVRSDAAGNSIGYGGGVDWDAVSLSTNGARPDDNMYNAQVDVSVWHTYCVEAKYNQITFFVDGQQMLQGSDNHYLKAGLVGLENNEEQIQVSSFKVFAL
jgi:hypothetical protein